MLVLFKCILLYPPFYPALFKPNSLLFLRLLTSDFDLRLDSFFNRTFFILLVFVFTLVLH